MVSLGSRMAVVCAMLAATGGGVSSCLNRPVTTTEPETSNIYVELTAQRGIDKIDLLFMIDNSASMSDKQEMLKLAVPQLLGRLIHPWCRNANGDSQPSTDGNCPLGFEPEFDPVDDIHIGVISSSLGSPEAAACADSVTHGDDAGHLLGLKRTRADGSPLETYQGLGFLAWDPKGKKAADGLPPGETDATRLVTQFQELVVATGETGCGYEASLEAWYRFLIDPAPPARWVVENGVARPEGVDTELLEERRQFLRPDSLVAIVMLSDENDCSLDFRGDGWRFASVGDLDDPGHLPRGTSICETDPNSPCCRTCGEEPNGPPQGCEAAATDPACAASAAHTDASDPRNLRCFEQKRRFGGSRLFPVTRYIDALKARTVVAYDGTEHPNPLFIDLNTGGTASRTEDLVFLAGIVGVPWQDIATSDSLGSGSESVLRYQDANSLRQNDVWSLILGDPTRNEAPLDPLMRESVEPRAGTTPGLAPLAPPEAAPLQNPVNGHEYYPRASADLQYACIFPLQTPVACGDDHSCDCSESASTLTPLCQQPSGAYGDTQLYAKAYPGLRHLQVLEGLGESGIVASICPKLVPSGDGSAPDPNVGYNPAVDALLEVVGSKLGGKCVPRQLAPDSMTGRVPCAMVEVLPTDAQGQCEPCTSVVGRRDPAPPIVRSVHKELRSSGRCSGPECPGLCLCEIEQSADSALDDCQNEASASAPGYCYIDAALSLGNPALVQDCPAQRGLRFVGDDTPRNGAQTFIACVGAPFGDTPSD